ncbi:protein NUCLEAR FUSION DEFECTIVE 4-like [Triticum dicoccoides]|nr:protein NUCLEAR FUSION DEFECTIVE 4-like [Triticum dicoccoides]
MPGAVKAGSRPPWLGLGAAVWLQASAGTSSAFALYSHALKVALGADQSRVALLGVACNVGDSLGLLPGVVCNKLHPALLLLVAAASGLLGYGVTWLAVSGVAPALPYWLIWIALCMGSNSGAWMSTAALVTNMRNFPLSRGAVAGILKGYSGLSAAVYTAIYTGALHGSAANLLLFLTLGVAIVCLLAMYFVRPCEPSLVENSSERVHFLFVQINSALLGVYLVVATTLDRFLTLTPALNYSLIAIMVILILAPFAIPVKMTLFRSVPRKVTSAAADNDHTEPFLLPSSSEPNFGKIEDEDAADIDLLLAEGEGAVKQKRRRPKRGEDFRFREALLKADFWLLFAVFFIGVGSGVTVLNNLAQVGTAAGVVGTTISVSLFSLGNFFGRLGGGAVSDYFVRSRTLPRTVLITCTQVVMIINYLVFALGLKATLYISVAILGICYGVHFSVMVSTSSELFGLKQFGKIYNFILLANPLGALVFSSLAGYVYDHEAAKQHSVAAVAGSDHVMVCYGPSCFRLTFFVLSGMACLGTFLSVILTVRIRPVYQMLYGGGPSSQPRNSAH